MKRAMISGSFDPVTLGHEELIRVASELFDEVTVAVCINSGKTGMFTEAQRVTLLKAACEPFSNVIVTVSDGLLAEYCRMHDIHVVVRGIRSSADFDYEQRLSQINRDIYPNLETVLIPAKPSLAHISSTVVREMIRYHHDAAPFVSKRVYEVLCAMT